MNGNKISILSTGIDIKLPAEEEGYVIDMAAFIGSRRVENAALTEKIQRLGSQPLCAVFTSRRAVEAIASWLGKQQTPWSIYCLGGTTRDLAEKYFGKTAIIGTADDASRLAELISQGKKIKEVHFFCGNRRREELPQILSRAHIAVEEMVVYDTWDEPRHIDKKYDAILFFSPSAVRSYFSLNVPAGETVLFALGNSTATEIKKHWDGPVRQPIRPDQSLLLSEVLEYFHLPKDEAINEK